MSTTLDSAAEAFGSLAAQHARVGKQRILLLAGAAMALMTLVLTFVVDLTRTNSSGQYADAVRRQDIYAETCDASLGRRRLWIGPVITAREFCVDHDDEDNGADEFPQPSFSFLVLGDWGRDGMCCQGDVAKEMSNLAAQTNPDFIVGAGDNFYERGIETASDKQVDRSWRSVYLDPYKALQRPWKIILGNHDYEGNVNAQVELSKVSPLWHLPQAYYFESFDEGKIFIAFLDTTCMYYTPEEMRRNRYRGVGITSTHRDTQLEALKRELARTTAIWKIVIGHHPFYSGSDDARVERKNQALLRTTLAPIFKEHGVATYISGHEHLLEHYDADGLQTFVSGAGSKIRRASFRQPKSIFSLGRQGFLQVALRNDTHVLHMRFFDMTGAMVHSAQITRPT